MKVIPRQPAAAPPRAFTLIELLTVVAIIGIVIAVGLPMLGSMQRSSAHTAAIDTVSTAASAGRAFAMRPIEFIDNIPGNNTAGVYSGAGAVFLYDKEHERYQIRLVENIQTIRNSTTYLEISGEEGFSNLSGFDPIVIPGTIGIAGIYRGTSGVEYISPYDPNTANQTDDREIMIWFNAQGVLQCRNPSDVFYDDDGDGVVNTTSSSSTFDGVEAVPGVMVFDRKQFTSVTGIPTPYDWDSLSTSEKTKVTDFMEDPNNTTAVFFSRYSGAAIRE